MLIVPDILLVLLALAIVAVDLVVHGRRDHRPCYRTAWIGLLVVLVVQCLLPRDGSAVYFNGYRITPWSMLFRQLFVACALLTVWLSEPYFREGGNRRGRLTRAGDFYAILVFSVIGMFTVVSACDLTMLFLGLEMATIPLYVLTAFQRNDETSGEAAIKYIVMGSLTTAIILFGYSLLYGAAGSLRFDAIRAYAAAHPADPLLLGGALFVLAAVCFKLAAAPFHMWAPDVYEGAPTPVTAYISVASKTAALGFMLLFFYGPLDPLRGTLAPVFVALAALSMAVGNLGALKQNNFRRFMAYSSVAQVGYILTAFLSDRAFVTGALVYYIAVYLAGNMGAFFVFSIVGQRREESLDSLHGLSRRQPVLAAVLLLCMFSLAGVPPLAGFTGKFLLFACAAQSGHYRLLLFAAFNSVASLYYYMLVIKDAYIAEPTEEAAAIEVPPVARVALALVTAALLTLGLWPGLNTLVFRIGAGL